MSRTSSEERVNTLWDYAVAHPMGYTRYDVERDLGWDYDTFARTTKRLRMLLGEDTINLVCDSQGKGQAWLYKLVGNYDEAQPWAANRLGDLETRLETVEAVSRSVVAATDGRSLPGRKARIIYKGVSRLVEDLGDLKHHEVA